MAFWDKFFNRRSAPPQETVNKIDSPTVTDNMLNNLALAESIYSNQPPWLAEESPPMKGSGLGALIAAKVARLVTIESKVSIDKSIVFDEEKRKILDSVLQKYLMENIRVEVEKGWALGGLILKPFYKEAEFELGPNNEIVKITGRLKIDFIYPSQFLINKYDNSGLISEIMFFTTIAQDSKYYTLVEKQGFDEKTSALKITNKLYKTFKKPTKYRWDDLGNDIVPLSTVEKWKNILPEMVFPNVQGTLVGFYKPAVANNVEVNSPYGMSGLYVLKML